MIMKARRFSFLFAALLGYLFFPVQIANAFIVSNQRYDSLLNNGVPEVPLRMAIDELERNPADYPRRDYMVIVDFRMASVDKRLFLLNLNNGDVEEMYVSHGRNSGWNYATDFSNVNGSNKSSIGAYRTAEIYWGANGKSMRLDGLDPTNDNARERYIVMHGADYVSEQFIQDNGRLGRSLGCPAVEHHLISGLIDKIHDGSLLYIYYDQ